MNGEALPPEHGFPVRMVVPGLYGYVSGTKWVVDIEATTFANPLPAGASGWSAAGRGSGRSRRCRGSTRRRTPPRSRRTRSRSRASRGPSTPGSPRSRCAWTAGRGSPRRSPTRSRSTPGGCGALELALPKGSHTVEARATDKSGYMQTDLRAEPIPNGATRLAERPLHREPRLTACGAPNGGPDATTGRPRPGGFREHDRGQDRNFVPAFTSGYRGTRLPSRPEYPGSSGGPDHPRDRRGEPVTVEALPRREATA